jgi:adenylate kinase
MPIVSFFGPPGSGKGTQSQRLRDELSLPYLATGDLIREIGLEDSALGEQMRAITAANAFVPDELIIEMVLSRVEDDAILDGFPRTLPQAEAFDRALAARGKRLDCVFFVDAPDEVVRERIVGRRLCSDCARPYHTAFAPPARPDVCDNCGGALVQRSDDVPEKIEKRLADYRALTEPMREYYAAGRLRIIDGTRPADEVAAAVRVGLASFVSE